MIDWVFVLQVFFADSRRVCYRAPFIFTQHISHKKQFLNFKFRFTAMRNVNT